MRKTQAYEVCIGRHHLSHINQTSKNRNWGSEKKSNFLKNTLKILWLIALLWKYIKQFAALIIKWISPVPF